MADWDVVSRQPAKPAASGGWDVVARREAKPAPLFPQPKFVAGIPEGYTAQTTPSAAIDRSLGELGSDALLRMRQGLNSVVGGVVEAPVGLLNLVNSVHAPLTGLQPMPQPEWVRGIQESGRIDSEALGEGLSPKAQAQLREFEGADGFLDSAKYLLQNPGFAATELGAQVPQLIPALTPGGVLPKVIATGISAAAQNAQGVREEALRRGKSEDEATWAAREAFNLTLPTAALSYIIPGGRQFEKLVSGQLGQSAVRSLLGRAGLFGKAAVGETATEAGQESLEQVVQNFALGDPLGQGTGKAAALGGLLGGMTGTVAGGYDAITARPPPLAAPVPRETPPSGSAIQPESIQPAPDIRPEDTADLDELLVRNIPPEVVEAAAAELGLPPETLGEVAGEVLADPDARQAVVERLFEADARWRPPTAASTAQSPAETAGSRPAGGDLASQPALGGDAMPRGSRENPLPESEIGSAPVGSWVRWDVPGVAQGESVRQVVEVPISEIDATEFDSAGELTPEKRRDGQKYAEAMRRGERFPNVRGSVLPNGKIKLQDGHRRLFAAMQTGAETIRVAVTPAPAELGGDVAPAIPQTPRPPVTPPVPTERREVPRQDEPPPDRLIGKLYQRGSGKSNSSVQALQLPDGSWRVRLRKAGRWMPWEEREKFDPSPAFGYRETATGSGTVRIPGVGSVPVEQSSAEKSKQQYNPLLDLIARSGGISRADARRFGVDPAEMNLRRGISPLFRENGVPLDRLREAMEAEGFFPAQKWDEPPQIDLNDVWDLVSKALAGETVAPLGDDTAMNLEIERREQLERDTYDPDEALAELYDEVEAETGEVVLPGDEAEIASIGELVDRLIANGMAPDDVAVELEWLDGKPRGEQARQLWQMVNQQEADRGPDRQATQRGDQGVREAREGEEGFALQPEAAPEPARQEVAPAAGLFGAPTGRERADAARRERDDKRDGRTGRDIPGVAGLPLFAGNRPEQADLATGTLPEQDVSDYGTTRPLPSGESSGVASPGAAPGRAARGQLRGQLDLFVATRDNRPPNKGHEPAVKVDRARLAQSARLVQTGQFRSGIERVTSLNDAAHILAPLRKSAQERFMVLAMDGDGRPLTVMQHTIDRIDGASVHPGMVFGAIASVPGVRSVVFAHNHPSGNPAPSQADRALDENLLKLFDGSGIDVRGSIILQPGRKTFTVYGENGQSAGRNAEPITTARRSGEVPVSERILRRVAPVDGRAVIRDPHDAGQKVLDNRDAHRSAVILLDNQHQVIGVLPFDQSQTVRLRTGSPETSHAAYAAQAVEANAAAAVVYGDEAFKPGVSNMARAMKAADIRVIDTFLFDADDQPRSQMSYGRDLSGGALESAEPATDPVLSDAERSSFARQREQGQARETQRQAATELSRQRGEADADANGLRTAVQAVIGGAKVPVRYLRGQAGLRGLVTEGFVGQLESQQRGRANTRTAGLYVTARQSADGAPFVAVFTDVAATPAIAAWTAAHEVAGHHSLRTMLGDKLDPALSIAEQNPTVKAVADSMMRQRRMPDGKRLLAVEEALADLAAAMRTGDFDRIRTKHGVEVPAAMRSRLRAAIDNFLRRLRNLLNRVMGLPEGQGFTDAQVRELLDNARKAAREPGTDGGSDAVLESAASQTDTPEFRRSSVDGLGDNRSMLRTIDDIRRLAEQHGGEVFVRWSTGPGADMRNGARSRDYVTGTEHEGLSAVPIRADMAGADIAKYLKEYGFLRMRGAAAPHVYAGDVVGTDSDGYPSIRPSAYLGTIDAGLVTELDAGLDRRMSLESEIADGEARLARITDPVGRDIVSKTVEKARRELAAISNRGTFDPDSPSILESVEAEGATNLPPRSGRMAPDDVRRADRRERAEPGMIERAKQDVHDQLEGLRKLGKGRPKNPQSLAQRANRFRGFLFDSVVSRARAIESRNQQSRSLRRLFNLVLTAPGENRLVGETMNEATERRFAQFTNRVRNVLSNEGMDRLTDAQNDQLRGSLLGTVTDAPPNIQRAARRIRRLMDVMREDLIAAGVEVGEVSDIGYLTRLYDEPRILTDEAGFLEAAERLYKDHEFAREVGTPRDMLYDQKQMVAFLGHARRSDNETVRDGLRRLKEAFASYRRSSNVRNEASEIQQIIASMYDLVARDYAQRSASAWLHQVKTPSAQQVFSGIGPSGAPVTKERVLSGAADTIMAEYLNTNVLDILDTYARTTAKKLAMAERFGPKGEKVQELMDAASREGVPKHDMDDALSLMESSLGHYTPVSDFKKAAADGLQAWTYLGLLARVAFSSMAESITFAIRTGDPVHAVAPLVQVWRATTGSQKGKDLADMALLIGVNGNKAMEEVMQNQLGGDYGMAPKWSKLIHRFMSGVMLMQLTRAQRAYGVGAATGYLRVLAKDVQAGKPEAAIYLNELGIADHQAFADWMLAQGTLPDNTEIHDADGRATPRGQDYMTAVRRIVDQTIQNPNASHRPEWMNSPLGRLLGAVMGFSYAFYENVIRRESALAASLLRDAGRGAAGKRMAQALGGAAALAIGQTAVSTIRELLFNAARFEDKDDEEIAEEMVMLGLSRTFGMGSGDPMIQYLTGLKYQRSVGETFLGAGLGTLASRTDAVAGVFTDRNSPNTDTAEYRAMEAIYSGVITPVANAVISRSPIPGLSAAAIPAVSSAQARRGFAGLFFEAPERETEADRKYRAALKDLEAVEDDVRGRLALLPDDQWKAEFEKMRAEFPVLLAGVELEVYKRGTNDGRFGPGDIKRDPQGRPRLQLEPGKGQGTVLGELEGYPYWYRKDGKAVQKTTEGIQDRITALNKAIKVLRDDETTVGELVKMAATITSEGERPVMDRIVGEAGGIGEAYTPKDTARRAEVLRRSERRAVLEELQQARRDEKRRAVELIEQAKRGEPIKRSN